MHSLTLYPIMLEVNGYVNQLFLKAGAVTSANRKNINIFVAEFDSLQQAGLSEGWTQFI